MQSQYEEPTNKKHSVALDFKVGDRVFVKAEFFYTIWPSKKLTEKYLGPFEIIASVGTSNRAVILHLPDSMCAVHPSFHVSMLEPATPNEIPNWIQPLPLPVIIKGEPKYEIDILDTKIANCWHFKLQYLVCWMGYQGTDEETLWIPATEWVFWYPDERKSSS